jgi:hypothetical protein
MNLAFVSEKAAQAAVIGFTVVAGVGIGAAAFRVGQQLALERRAQRLQNEIAARQPPRGQAPKLVG